MLNWRLLRDWIEPRFQACLAFLPWLIELLKSWRSLPSNLEWSTVTVCDMFCMGYHYFLTLKIDGCCVWQAFAGRSLLSNPEGSTVTVRQALHGRSLPSSPERLCVVCDRPGMGDCCLLTLNDVLCVVCDRPGMGDCCLLTLKDLRLLWVRGDREDQNSLVHDGLAADRTSELRCSADEDDGDDNHVLDVTVHGSRSL